MKALTYQGPGEVRIVEIPDPTPGPGEVLLEVSAAGICGTDRHIVAGELGVAAGTVPGHEIAGRVVGLGIGTDTWAIGSRALSYGQVVCKTCRCCREGDEHRCRRPEVMGMTRQGGFAEFVAVPEQCLVAVPDTVTDEVAAIVPDAIATPYHALVTVGDIAEGETVVIIGAGGLGIQAVILARMRGAGRIIAVDPNETARDAALDAGADDVLDPAAEGDQGKALYTLTSGASLALECVGRAESVELGMRSLAPGGRLVVVGIGQDRPRLPPLIRFVAAETSVHGSFGSTIAEIEEVLEMIADGRLDTSRSVSLRVSLDEAADVFTRPATPGRTVIIPRTTR